MHLQLIENIRMKGFCVRSSSFCFEKGFGTAWSGVWNCVCNGLIKNQTRYRKCGDVCGGRRRGIQCDDKQGIHMDTLVAVWGSLKQISTCRDNFLEPFVWDHF